MYVINDNYAIKNDGLCFAVCYKPKKSKSKLSKAKQKYKSKWYFNTLDSALCFLIDKAIEIPKDLQIMSDDICQLKTDIKNMIEAFHSAHTGLLSKKNTGTRLFKKDRLKGPLRASDEEENGESDV